MKKQQINNGIIARAKAPTPNFFKKLRLIGLSLAATGTVIITAPISLPALITTIGGYCLVAGGVASAVSQLTIDQDKVTLKQQNDGLK